MVTLLLKILLAEEDGAEIEAPGGDRGFVEESSMRLILNLLMILNSLLGVYFMIEIYIFDKAGVVQDADERSTFVLEMLFSPLLVDYLYYFPWMPIWMIRVKVYKVVRGNYSCPPREITIPDESLVTDGKPIHADT
ncbi:hypothetical protein MKW98_027756 [Papaver atlanticum]|uniref:Uncharacterized protein n=1 Tax=Papaver atlanticum TaxID=357466 RepID=A0AAD4SY13_9MAGN|nr:hypothetical protein MKW98_027756 [Papaver atlanticum]